MLEVGCSPSSRPFLIRLPDGWRFPVPQPLEGGFGVALVWLWCGFGVALVWLSVGYQLALGGFGMALVWLCVALVGFARPPSPPQNCRASFQASSHHLASFRHGRHNCTVTSRSPGVPSGTPRAPARPRTVALKPR